MPARKYHVALSDEQRQHVESIARSYRHSERERKRAKILLLTDTNREDGGPLDAQICHQLKVSDVTVGQVRRRFACQVSENGSSALSMKARSSDSRVQ